MIYKLKYLIMIANRSLLYRTRDELAVGNDDTAGEAGTAESLKNALYPYPEPELSLGLIIGVAIGGSLVIIMLIMVIVALIVCIRSGKPPRRRSRQSSPSHLQHHQ